MREIEIQVKSLLTYKMTLRRLLVLALHLCCIANVGYSFNIDTDFPIFLGGPNNNGNLNKHFGHSLQIYQKVSGLPDINTNMLNFQDGQTKILVGDPLNVNRNNEETGAVFECRYRSRV